MIELSDIAALERKLRDTRVLSVYINGAVSDPAERNTWRITLDKSIAETRDRIASSDRAERAAFESAVEAMNDAIPEAPDLHANGAWVGFFPATGDAVTQFLPAHVPDTFAWGDGIRVSPMLRALKQRTPVYIVLADSRTAQLFRYRERVLDEVESFSADANIGPVYHMGDAPRAGFHAGVRGTTGTDEAERVSRAATERMYREVVEKVNKIAAEGGWVLLGGTVEACSALEADIPQRIQPRMTSNTSLHMRSRQQEIIDAAKEGASELRARADASMLDTLSELAGAGGRGAVGFDATTLALRDKAVSMILFSSALLEKHPEEAEDAIRAALAQGADVEHVTGEAAEKIDELGGVAARLRFVREEAQAV